MGNSGYAGRDIRLGHFFVKGVIEPILLTQKGIPMAAAEERDDLSRIIENIVLALDETINQLTEGLAPSVRANRKG